MPKETSTQTIGGGYVLAFWLKKSLSEDGVAKLMQDAVVKTLVPDQWD